MRVRGVYNLSNRPVKRPIDDRQGDTNKRGREVNITEITELQAVVNDYGNLACLTLEEAGVEDQPVNDHSAWVGREVEYQ